jgi:hypothetical protein
MYCQREKEYEIVDVLPAKGRLLARRSETLRQAQGFHFLHIKSIRGHKNNYILPISCHVVTVLFILGDNKKSGFFLLFKKKLYLCSMEY